MGVTQPRLPSVFAGHGGGPLPVLGDPNHKQLTQWMRSLAATLPRPQAILLISAHWETERPTFLTNSRPSMLYDYYGFPPEAYEIQYPAPGHPELAKKAMQLLRSAGLDPQEDATRGFDHGVYVPLKLIYPEADIPVLEMSVLSSLDPEEHIKVGEALAPLRDEGVLVLASGFSAHNMRLIKGAISDVEGQTKAWDAYLQDAMTNPSHSPAQRRQLLVDWAKAPGARLAHEEEEHLMPLMVAAGAARLEAGTVIHNGELWGIKHSCFQFP